MSGGTLQTFPPWLEPRLDDLVRMVAGNQAPPGLLVTGPQGVGKGVLARAFLQRIACTDSGGERLGCGQCNGCRSFLGASHPEILHVTPEEPGKEILVDRVREVIEFLSLSHNGPARLVFIEPAESMNMNAANALLKTLEEPPGGAMLLLSAARPARLPATVRSRCRLLRIPVPDRGEVAEWLGPEARQGMSVEEALAACLDRPMEARALLEDDAAQTAWQADHLALAALLRGASPFTAIERFLACNLPSLLPRLQRLLLSAQRYLVTGELDAFGRMFDADGLRRFATRLGVRETAMVFQDTLRWQRELQVPLNPHLRCESMVLRLWRDPS